MTKPGPASLDALRHTALRAAACLALGGAAFACSYAVTLALKPRPGAAPEPAPPGMVWIPGGEFTMGTDAADAWSDERPAHRVAIDGFWLDKHEVTNAQFAAFVEATGYQTTAERTPEVAELLEQLPPGTPAPDPADLVAGSMVFFPPAEPVPTDDYRRWWKWVPGANWRHPEGPESTLAGREEHPVVQVSWDDALAYAEWAGKRLPTEAEWERGARGGLDGKPFIWGDQAPADKVPAGENFRANLWQGEFPHRNTAADGYERTAPVESFAPNAYGLHDMAGNVWEWCSDWYQRDLYADRTRDRVTRNPQGPVRSSDPARSFMPQRTQKGGSFLCHETYCSRYRPSARHGCSPDTGMSHVGFRCAKFPIHRVR